MRAVMSLLYRGALAVVISVSAACAPQQGPPLQAASPASPSAPPSRTRFFDEKVRCAAVGDRWDKLMCEQGGRRSPTCVGFWAYNPKRDTCVGVFYDRTFTQSAPPLVTLYVVDMLTNADLEEPCLAGGPGSAASRKECDLEGAKKRWIVAPPE